jgi:hypothetical protein
MGSNTKSAIPLRSRILGRKAFAAITAVEGLHLSDESRKRLDALEAADISEAARRAAVLKAYKGAKRRK